MSQQQVLIVDDEPRNIRILEGMLLAEPYRILTARSGAEALEIFEQATPDLVLLDIMMPLMDGFEVCRRIKSHPEYRMIPVVMVTALTDVKDRIAALEAGTDDFLSKPVDVTELILRVRSLLRMRQLYLEKERMVEQRLRFMSGIAHDIRSPITSLGLNLETLQRRLVTDDERLQGMWQRVKIALAHIEKLATDTMSYYRMESGQLELHVEPCELDILIHDAAHIAYPLAAEHQSQLEIAPVPAVTCTADRAMIVQVLLNLLTNAIKYSLEGRPISVQCYDLANTSYTLPLQHYPPMLVLPKTGIVVEVTDLGIGIAEADFERVFKEFDRLGTTSEGVGLGLALSQRLIRLHGGELWFTSQLNRGSTFAFFLPQHHHIA